MAYQTLDKTPFLNVDLIVYSKMELQLFIDAMGKKVIVLHAGRLKRSYETHFELPCSPLPQNRHSKSPEALILGFCKLIQGLPPEARKDWDAAKTRTFDIGIEAPGRNSYYWSAISEKVIKAASEVNAQIAITVYGPMKTTRKPSKVASSI
jgi:hypothetical protein